MIWFYRRLRLFLDLRQGDVARATGVAAWKIAAAEAGRVQLTELEESLVREFLRDRLRVVVAMETQDSDAGRVEEITRNLMA